MHDKDDIQLYNQHIFLHEPTAEMSVGSPQVGVEISTRRFEYVDPITSFQFQRSMNVQETDKSTRASYNDTIVMHLNNKTFWMESTEAFSPIISLKSEVVNASSRGCEDALVRWAQSVAFVHQDSVKWDSPAGFPKRISHLGVEVDSPN